ncbi:hypothetical protein EDC01DRAFT_725611 [Geopyxis carbonaria]|nr:hypothetical protein EDC01DRAFT_725611 [Geopyxis carbonaria]
MFRLASRKGLARAVPRPSLHLSNSPAPRNPSSATLVRRLSPAPIPHLHPPRKLQQDAYVNTPETSGPDPSEILDITPSNLRHAIAELVGVRYHAAATPEAAKEVAETAKCWLFSGQLRPVFPAVVAASGVQARWVFFVVDTAAPLTYLSSQTSELFGISEGSGPSIVSIAGHHTRVHRAPARSRFAQLDVVGMDFLQHHRVALVQDLGKRRVQLWFGGGWGMVRTDRMCSCEVGARIVRQLADLHQKH